MHPSDRPLVLVNGWFLNHLTAGSGQYLLSLLQGLATARSEIRLRVLVPVTGGQGAHWTPKMEFPSNCEYLPVSLMPGPKPLAKIWWEQAALPLQCVRHRPDLLWSPYWAAPVWCPVPFVVTVHDIVPLLRQEYQRSAHQRGYVLTNLMGLRKAKAVITVSQSSADTMHRLVPEVQAEVAVVYNGAEHNATKTHDEGSRRQIQKNYGLPEEFFLYLGGFERRKNVETILKAYQRYLDLGGNPELKLVLAGQLPHRNTAVLQHPAPIIQTLGLGDQVILTGTVPDSVKWDLYSMSQAFLFPGLAEGFGLPVVEAMQSGTPVITSRF